MFNSASSGYGTDIGAYPFKLKVETSLTTVTSGSSMSEPLLVVVQDYYGDTFFLEDKQLGEVLTQMGNITLNGETKITPVAGVYNYTLL